MLGLFSANRVVDSIIARLPAPGSIGRPILTNHGAAARKLIAAGYSTVVVGRPHMLKRRTVRNTASLRLCARLDRLPLPTGSMAAAIAADVGRKNRWADVLAEWRRVLILGGMVVVFDQSPAAQSSSQLLCNGLSDVRQSAVGQTTITSGRILAEF